MLGIIKSSVSHVRQLCVCVCLCVSVCVCVCVCVMHRHTITVHVIHRRASARTHMHTHTHTHKHTHTRKRLWQLRCCRNHAVSRERLAHVHHVKSRPQKSVAVERASERARKRKVNREGGKEGDRTSATGQVRQNALRQSLFTVSDRRDAAGGGVLLEAEHARAPVAAARPGTPVGERVPRPPEHHRRRTEGSIRGRRVQAHVGAPTDAHGDARWEWELNLGKHLEKLGYRH